MNKLFISFLVRPGSLLAEEKPNIIDLLADHLCLGDISIYEPTKFKPPTLTSSEERLDMTKKTESSPHPKIWPQGLPQECQCCGNGYDIRFALEIGPEKLGRFLRQITPWVVVASFLSSFLLCAFLGMAKQDDQLAKAIFIIVVILPTLIILIIRSALPAKARLYCYKCNKAEYFHPPDFLNNRITPDSE